MNVKLVDVLQVAVSPASCCRSVLAAACEHNDLLMFDPHNGKLIGSKDAAHSDSVNCVRCVSAPLFLFVVFRSLTCLRKKY